ncbi:MAG: 50S ribosomal protein L4 [Synergistales bacterium]|nr:50S ribosomal protein L4 [Synergistales bacterium]
MANVKRYNFQGELIGEEHLADAVFDAPVHVPAMHQVVVAQQANRRVGTANTKNRGDVRGGGRKPWRQKHTGRARAGSSRSPVWVGGGVAHGPHPRNYRQKVNKKMRRLAMRSALSVKTREEQMLVFDKPELEAPKTKSMLAFLENVNAADKPLIVLHESDGRFYKSVSNIPGARAIHVDSLNVYDILNARHLVMTEAAARKVEEVFAQ